MIDLKKLIPLSFIFSILLLFGSANAQSQYDFRGFASSLDVTELGITFNYTGGTCNAQMSSTNTFTTLSGTFDSTITWKSPDATTLGFSTLTGLSNTSCLSYGQTSLQSVSTDVSSGYFESSWDVTHSADSGFVNTRTRYICESPTERTTFFVSNGTDSRGDCLYGTRTISVNNRIQWLNQLSADYNRCGDLTDWSTTEDCALSFPATCTNCQKTAQFIYPINSSATGDVIFNITENIISILAEPGAQEVDITFTLDLINTETQDITNLDTRRTFVATNIQSFNQAEGTLSLAADTLYLLVFTFNTTKSGGVNYAFTAFGPTINLSIFTFRPQYVCGEFGECINGSQSRVCVDSLSVAPDRIETRSCFDVPADTIDLGFETILDGAPRFIYTCQLDWTLVSCLPALRTINARFPVNWTISADSDSTGAFRQNYIRISDDTSTAGTRSLQMNYIPPKLAEPVSDPGNASLTVCGNKTVGDFPFVTTGLNQSLFVSRNISFPSPFIQLRLDARKCAEPILQYDYTSSIYSLCDIAGVQRKLCYSTNCSEEPGGNYRVGVFDAQTLEQIVEFTDTAINSWTSNIIDLSNAGLLINHNYTIIIVVNPQTETGVFDPNSHCVYFDNFRVTITETALPECITRCEGFNLLLANQNDNVCFFSQVTNSPACAPDQSTAESFQSFESVCIGTTLHFFNNDTGLWDQTTNSDLCIEQEAAVSDALNATTPLPTTADNIEFFNFLFSPIFLYIFFSLIISGILSAGISRVTGNGDGVFQVFGVTMLIFVLLGTLPGIAAIPIWISVAIIAVISLLIAQKLRGFGFPGGGG